MVSSAPLVLLVVLWCYCLHQANSSEQQYQYQLQQHAVAKQRANQQLTAAQKEHQQRQQVHYNRKHQQQHSNYKQQIQHQRQGGSYKKRPVYHYKKKYHYKKRKYKYIKWPKIRGRCKYSPWKVEGVNPVLQEAEKGNMVLLYMLKVNDAFSYNQLTKMNDLAEHYESVGKKVSVLALSHRSRSLPASYRTRFPFVKFYQEPGRKNIYSMLKTRYQNNIIYDKCGRQQYHFQSPYSWLGYEFTRLAIDNVLRFHTDYQLCGICRAPKTTVRPVGNYTGTPSFNATTTARETKPTQLPVDGPYTNIPLDV